MGWYPVRVLRTNDFDKEPPLTRPCKLLIINGAKVRAATLHIPQERVTTQVFGMYRISTWIIATVNYDTIFRIP